MPAKHMKTTTLVTKAQLHDYVTKFEFNEFAGEMRDFREETSKRFDRIDRRIDRLEESFRVQTGVILEEMRTISQATMEYIQGIESRLGSRLAAVEAKIGG